MSLAYFKNRPEDMGEIINVYILDGQKRLTVEFEYGTIIDALAEEFEVVNVSS